jgi:galactonate dehydratase
LPPFGKLPESVQALVEDRQAMKITKLETFLVKPRWLFLKMHTDEGIVGLGEPILEGRALTCQTAVKELEPWLIGEDPTRVVHLWQSMYKHAFYRGGEIMTSALSGVEQALWDITGKYHGVPVYKLLGGPTRDRIRVYGRAGGSTPDEAAASVREAVALGFNCLKTGLQDPAYVRPPSQSHNDRFTGMDASRRGRIIESPGYTERVVEIFAAMRAAAGPDVDIAIDFHGAIPPQTAKRLIAALEPYHPFFVEEPVQAQNVDVLADLARSTSIPIAAGERLYTKWGFRELLEKRAASILQPDLSHAGGIMETRLIAGMAEAYYAGIAPHCPLGPIALAACLQLDAIIPNFLAQENGMLTGEGYIKTPFKQEGGYLPLPTAPGLGIELDEEALADKIGHDWQNPKAYAEDGSAIDW